MFTFTPINKAISMVLLSSLSTLFIIPQALASSQSITPFIAGETLVTNGEIVLYKASCYQAKHNPGVWETPHENSWFWHVVPCVDDTVDPDESVGHVTENIARADYAFSNTSLVYGDNGYQEDPLGMSLAFDSDPFTSWHPASKQDSWLGQLFPVSMKVSAYAINGSVENFKFQASHDGISWQTLDNQRHVDVYNKLTEFTIDEEKAGSYRYYRIYTMGDNNAANINMLEIYGHTDENELQEDVTSSEYAFSSSNAWIMTDTAFEYLPHLHQMAFDDISGGTSFSSNTYWRPISQENEWIGQHFLQPQLITRYSITLAYASMSPNHWQLQASLDAKNWVVIDERQDANLTGQESQTTFDIAASQQGAYQHYRLYFPANNDAIAISNIELLAGSASTSPVPKDDAVMVVIRDSFAEKPWYDEGSHGGFVMAVAQGAYNTELNVDEEVVFKTSNINTDRLDSDPIDLSEEAFKADVVNMSSSSYNYSAALNGVKYFNDHYPQNPLKITSAGNSITTCTAEAAELGRTVGLSSSDLAKHFEGLEESEWEHFYKACDMTVVAAIDKEQAESWIVVAGYLGDEDNPRPQKPFGILKDRGVVAPYTIDGKQGTSFSAPYVSAVAAMIKSRAPQLSAKEVANIIFITADDLGEPGVDEVWGHGLVNPVRAMDYMDAQGY